MVYEVDLAGKFSGRKVFIEEVEKAVPHFYQEAGQWLKAWTPPAPKIEKQTYESAAAEPQASDQEERQASD
ncbi:hypothetical protein [Marinobacter lutaoensis]|uniref:hypothetical protein n=1 Tax=Marinobacter lutaoensis TaxID=135739 RepID=UPI0020CCA5C7|nr:hypothetical protein [Marinobacter lutaoensis]